MAMSPFRGRGFYDAQSEINRLFDEMLGGLTRRSGGQQRAQVSEWAPAMDVVQKDGDLVVRAELPGVKLEDVDITVHDRVLTVSGERKVEQETERGGYLVRERRHGSFRRSMQLPEGVDEENIRARFQDGVLEVTLEGAAAVREPKRIQIESGTSEGESTGEQQGPGGQQQGSDSYPHDGSQHRKRTGRRARNAARSVFDSQYLA